MRRKTLEQQIRYAERQLAHKREVQAKHAPGTAWHTRAKLEADGWEERLVTLRHKLQMLDIVGKH